MIWNRSAILWLCQLTVSQNFHFYPASWRLWNKIDSSPLSSGIVVHLVSFFLEISLYTLILHLEYNIVLFILRVIHVAVHIQWYTYKNFDRHCNKMFDRNDFITIVAFSPLEEWTSKQCGLVFGCHLCFPPCLVYEIFKR